MNKNDSYKPAILLVDDEEMVLKALLRVLKSPSWDLVAVDSGPAALEALSARSFVAVISDQRMPEMTGIELLAQIKKNHPQVIRILLTGYAEMNLVVEAINQGEVYRFFTKPWNASEIKATLAEIVERSGREQARLQKVTDQLLHANLETVMALAEAIELKDHYTKGHCSRVRDYSLKMALAMHLEPEFCRHLVYASLLHDSGKIGVSESILNVNGPLSEEQFIEVRRHPLLGFEMTSKIDYLRPASLIIRHHHERWDGHGYPDALKGKEISLGARIVAIADSFDAMTSSRPYRRALDFKKAIAELVDGRGSQFDPELVDLFVSLMTSETDNAGLGPANRSLLLVGLPEDLRRQLREALPTALYQLDFIDFSVCPELPESFDMVICSWRQDLEKQCLDLLNQCRSRHSQAIRILEIDRDELKNIGDDINRAGLYSYLVTPLRPGDIQALVDNAFEWQSMARTLQFSDLGFLNT